MCHDSVKSYVEKWVTELDLSKRKVLDIGSYDVNGKNKDWFTGEYIGLDFREGPNVDVVSNSWSIPYDDQSFEVIVSTEMLEHDEFPAATFKEIGRLLKPKGFVILTARGPGYPEHEYPSDFNRFTPRDFRDWLTYLGMEVLDASEDPEAPGAFAVGYLPENTTIGGDSPTVRGLC
jgi:SAM-dependent methyltransferase